MLRHLYIKNYVIIDEIELDLKPGMSVFTGETGAGKSIIIDAIGLLCGNRLLTNVVAQDKDKAFIEGIFSFDNESIRVFLEAAGIDISDEYVISREITADGKSTMRLNYRVVTQTVIRDLLSLAVDIHNQHDTQYLLNSRTHRQLLDTFAHDEILANEVKEAYTAYRRLRDELTDRLANNLNENDVELLNYQKQEIEDAGLYEGEYNELMERQKAMMTFEKTNSALSEALETISGSEGALEKLFTAAHALSELSGDDQIAAWNSALNDKYYEIEELTSAISVHRDELYFDENELNQIQERLFFLGKLRRKYGDDYPSIMKRYDDICERLAMINDRQAYIDKMEKAIAKALADYQLVARRLTLVRRQKGAELTDLIVEQLRDLQLPNTRFETALHEQEPAASGNENIEFMISTNVGQPLSPLSKVASGGELSRIMLGLKTIFNSLQGISTIIFDEIDSGVSGSIATAIGLKMHYLSHDAQVLSVTHLGQVAACADNHYFVSKTNDTQKTTSMITHLDQAGRIRELALIASGKLTDNALKAAAELLEANQALSRKA